MTRRELIAKLEAAPEGSRELDFEISLVVDHKAGGGIPRWESIRDGVAQDGRGLFLSDALGYVDQIPRFSRSIDAALTLVPREPRNEASGIYDYQLESTNGGLTISARVGNGDPCFADTLPLALTIAALKARTLSQPLGE